MPAAERSRDRKQEQEQEEEEEEEAEEVKMMIKRDFLSGSSLEERSGLKVARS